MTVVKFHIMNVLDSVLRLSLFTLLISPSALLAQSETHRMESIVTDYEVYRLEHSNGYIMLSGLFNYAGQFSGSGTLIDASGNLADPDFPKITGSVYTVIQDGSGGWYVGGLFSSVNNLDLHNLIHINSDHTLDTDFNPNPASSVQALVLDGNILYVGGNFQFIKETTRNFVAAIDVSTGNLTSWNPSPNGVVNTIAINGNTMYIGGTFTTIGATPQTRNRVAAFDKNIGALSTWNPSVTGTSAQVNSIVVDNAQVYIGGSFSTVGITPRSGLAAVNATTGAVNPTWNPNPATAFGNGTVYTMLLSGSVLYVGGYFVTIGGATRSHIAAINTTSTGTALSWNPVLSNSFDYVQAIALSGTTLYMSGYFTTVNGTPRNSLAAVSTANASLLPWNPDINGYGLRALAVNGTDVFVGGNIRGINWDYYPGIAIVNTTTDQLVPFVIDLEGGFAWTMAVKDNIAYIGGEFSVVNKQPRDNLFAINLTNGQILPWAPSVTGTLTGMPAFVTSVKIKDNLLYTGGHFLNINNQSRSGLAAIDLTTGVPNNWNPNVGGGGTVNSFDMVGNNLYIGGDFTTVGGQARTDLAAVDINSGATLPWAPTCDCNIYRIRVALATAYVTGDFGKEIGGQFRPNRIAGINLTTGAGTSFNPDLRNGVAVDIALSETDLYVAGFYDSVGLQPRNGLASFSLINESHNTWKPDIGLPVEGGPRVYAVATSSTRLFVGGSFEYLGEENRTYYGEYDICPSPAALSFDGNALTSTPADTYQWYLNDAPLNGETSQSLEINAFEYGTYYVEVNNNGCVSRSDDFVYLITSPESSVDDFLVAYPNPVRDDLYIKASSHNNFEIILLDIMGRQVKKVLYTDSELHINMEDLNSGTYLLMVQSNGQKQMKKIVKVN